MQRSMVGVQASPASGIMLALFALNAVTHLVSLGLEADPVAMWTKFLLMPLLAAWVVARRGPALVVLALLFSAAGDIALRMSGTWFLVGMGFFGVAHACYVTFFIRRRCRLRWPVLVAYAVALGGLVVALWPGLGELRIPVIAYALLLSATGVTSAGFARRTGIGGALFFVSDAMIAWGIADLPRVPGAGLWIMSTYIVAQFLLASGSQARQARA